MARLRSEGLRGGGSPCAGVWGGLERCVEGQNRGRGGGVCTKLPWPKAVRRMVVTAPDAGDGSRLRVTRPSTSSTVRLEGARSLSSVWAWAGSTRTRAATATARRPL